MLSATGGADKPAQSR